jgi:hypothetical protein
MRLKAAPVLPLLADPLSSCQCPAFHDAGHFFCSSFVGQFNNQENPRQFMALGLR